MGIKEEWASLPGQTKMMIVGGGGLATFFLMTAIRNKNRNTATQDTSVGPQTLATDPSSSINSYDQNVQAMQQLIGGMADSLTQNQQAQAQADQQNISALQEVVSQNQQATLQAIQGLTDKMGKVPSYPPTTPPSTPVTKTPTPTKTTPTPTKTTPTPTKTASSVVYKAYGTDSANSSIWGLSKMYLENHGGLKNPTNAQVKTEVNKVVSLNKIKNPSVIQKGQAIKMS